MMDLTLLYDASVVVDNNVLQDFAELGRMDLLFRVFKTINIPKILFHDEVEEFVKVQLKDFDYKFLNIDQEISREVFFQLTNIKKYRRLSSYDKQVIARAGLYDCDAGSNDGLVRRACEEFRIKYTGSLGIIGCTFQKGFIDKSEFIQLIGKIRSDETSCYIKDSTIKAFLENVDIKILADI